MGALTANDIATRVKRQFGDESGVQVMNDDILRWINDAQREAFSQHENLRTAFTVQNLSVGQEDYSLPADCINIQTVRIKQDSASNSYYDLRYLARSVFAEMINGTDGGNDWPNGTPAFYTRGDSEDTIHLFPAPDTAVTSGLKIVYSRYSVDLATLNSEIDLPEYYHQYVLEYCLMKAYEMDEDWEAADKKAAYVQSTLDFNNNREGWFGRQTYPVVVTTDEDYI